MIPVGPADTGSLGYAHCDMIDPHKRLPADGISNVTSFDSHGALYNDVRTLFENEILLKTSAVALSFCNGALVQA